MHASKMFTHCKRNVSQNKPAVLELNTHSAISLLPLFYISTPSNLYVSVDLSVMYTQSNCQMLFSAANTHES